MQRLKTNLADQNGKIIAKSESVLKKTGTINLGRRTRKVLDKASHDRVGEVHMREIPTGCVYRQKRCPIPERLWVSIEH